MCRRNLQSAWSTGGVKNEEEESYQAFRQGNPQTNIVAIPEGQDRQRPQPQSSLWQAQKGLLVRKKKRQRRRIVQKIQVVHPSVQPIVQPVVQPPVHMVPVQVVPVVEAPPAPQVVQLPGSWRPSETPPGDAFQQGYTEAYNVGFDAGFAKGFEDGHKLELG